MLLAEREMTIPLQESRGSLLQYFREEIIKRLSSEERPIRFVVTRTDKAGYHCELGVITGTGESSRQPDPIFDFHDRGIQNCDEFNAVMIVPTGIGAEVGGHAGDAAPVSRVLASVCDTLITHPNVVNASDINELTENSLYVEGSVLSELMMGNVGLQKVRANRVMMVMDKHPDENISNFSVNAVSAARSALGIDCSLVVEMDPPIRMRAEYSKSGCAVGEVEGLQRICKVLQEHEGEYDAVAVASVIKVPEAFHLKYFRSGGSMVNPWGGVEAMLTHGISLMFNIPSAHSPMMESMDVLNLNVGVVDPRMSAEAVSTSFLHSVLKGLHRSPRIITDRSLFSQPSVISASDISCLIVPSGCIGLPTLAALEQGVPVIEVRENRNRMQNRLEDLPFAPGKHFVVGNYLEAVGVMSAIKAGVSIQSVQRPLKGTTVVSELVEIESTNEEAADCENLSTVESPQGRTRPLPC